MSAQQQQTDEDEDEDGHNFTHIDELQARGVAAIDLQRLKAAGVLTVQTLARAPRRRLLEIKGFSEAKIDKLQENARRLVPMGFVPASEIHEQRRKLVFITTGCKELDTILKGGIESGSITEVYGESQMGKTQLCHTLSVTCQLPHAMGGAEGKVMYIDTQGTFRPLRFIEIAQRYNLSPADVLDNVLYVRPESTDHQLSILTRAADEMSHSKFGLLVVDSASALYRREYVGRGELQDRQTALARFLASLQHLASTFGVAVLITNEVVANVSGGNFSGPKFLPVGGHIMAHATTTRLWFKNGPGGHRVCKIMGSPSLAAAEASFQITADGIYDSDV